MELSKNQIETMISDKLRAGKRKFGAEFEFLVLEILGLQKLLWPEPEEKEREIPLVEWNKYHSDPSIPALRMLVFRKDENGFNDVIVRRGNRVLIKENAYFKWREAHAGG